MTGLESTDVRLGIMNAMVGRRIQETYFITGWVKVGRTYEQIEIPARFCPFCGKSIKNGKALTPSRTIYSPKKS
jgi:wobble nucleotide-excising tRNase